MWKRTWRGRRRVGLILEPVGVSLRDQIPVACSWVNDTCCSHAYSRIDIHASVEISSQEWNVHVAAKNDDTGLGVDLIDVVLSSCKEDILDAIIAGENEWL